MQTETPTPADEKDQILSHIPSTRYQGSKAKILPWIYDCTKDLEFASVLDAFGGTGVVSYLFKKMGKRVVYNDYLLANHLCGVALIENSSVHLSAGDLDFLLQRHKSIDYPTFIADTFNGVYYTAEENTWLDQTVTNIRNLANQYSNANLQYKTALAYHALTQSALMKRPFNLFHRKNLYVRTADVARSFGNKTTWETPFPVLFRRFARESRELVFGNGKRNKALHLDAMQTPRGFDLVYVDTPYLSTKSSGVNSDYHAIYHFLDGMCQYEEWATLIDEGSPHRRLRNRDNGWNDRGRILDLFAQFMKRHLSSKIVISYRTPGVPSRDELEDLLASFDKKVTVHQRSYRYALNKRNGKPGENIEVLIIGV